MVDALPRTADQTVVVSIDHLRVGAVCRFPLEDENGLLLLGAGTRITREVINGMRERGIFELAIHKDDPLTNSASDVRAPARPTSRASVERPPVAGEHCSNWTKGVPLKAVMVNRRAEPLHPGRRQRLKEQLQTARGQFESLQVQVTEQKLQTISAMQDLSSAFAMAIVDDHDQTIGELVRPTDQYALTDRSVRLSVLGMAVGTEMELDGPSILELGTCGLLHDIGLFSMDASLVCAGREPLTESQMWEYRKHPTFSANCLREVSDVPHGVLLAIEQVHEQFDGSGFPFGIEGKRAHVYARILNVCDTFLQLTMGTSFRRPLVPHDAMGLILHQARYGLFDPKVIHAFLRTESLFPLGSRVELNTGEVADVIRRPEYGYGRPIVQDQDGRRIELENESIEIVRPVADESCAQVRLTVDEMQSLRWNPGEELILND